MKKYSGKLILVTGMSGAGRTSAMRILEDLGFEAVDNLPLKLLKKLVFSLDEDDNNTAEIKLAVGVDIRGRDFNPDYFFKKVAEVATQSNLLISTLFVDSDDITLIKRYKETRRLHPFAPDRPIADGLKLERSLIIDIRQNADVVIDTGPLQISQLKERMRDIFGNASDGMSISLMSFGFKKGLPREADLVFDVRFLTNPYYDEKLRHKNGMDADVGKIVASDDDFPDFFNSLKSMLNITLPRYQKEGKSHLTIAIGCTGGRHRSVFIVEKLAYWLKNNHDYMAYINHRDLNLNIN